jgi:hypothetical protein
LEISRPTSSIRATLETPRFQLRDNAIPLLNSDLLVSRLGGTEKKNSFDLVDFIIDFPELTAIRKTPRMMVHCNQFSQYFM